MDAPSKIDGPPDDRDFRTSANFLCANMAMILGWRPDEFWNATPAEIDCILTAAPQQDRPIDRQMLSDLIANEA